jgi:hypothetical protein
MTDDEIRDIERLVKKGKWLCPRVARKVLEELRWSRERIDILQHELDTDGTEEEE